MNTADWIALGIIAAALICAVIYIVKHRGNCCGSCTGCPYHNECGKDKNKSDKN